MAITFPQTPVTNGFAAPQASLTCTVTAISAGDIVVLVGRFHADVTGVTVSDGGDTPTTILAPVITTTLPDNSYTFCSAFYTPAAGRTAFTATFGGSPAYGDMYAYVIRGITTPALDKSLTTATGNGTAIASGTTGTLANANEAIIAFAFSLFNGVSAGGGGAWTFDGVSTNACGAEHQVVSSTSAVNGTFTAGGTDDWVAYLFSFYDAFSGAPLLPPTFTESEIYQMRRSVLVY